MLARSSDEMVNLVQALMDAKAAKDEIEHLLETQIKVVYNGNREVVWTEREFFIEPVLSLKRAKSKKVEEITDDEEESKPK